MASDGVLRAQDQAEPMLVLTGIRDLDELHNEVSKAIVEGEFDDFADEIRVPMRMPNSLPKPELWTEFQGDPVYMTQLPYPPRVSTTAMGAEDMPCKTSLYNDLHQPYIKSLSDYWIGTKNENDHILGHEGVGEYPGGIACRHCYRMPESPMGIPFAVKVQSFNRVMTMFTRDVFCNFRCAFASTEKNNKVLTLIPLTSDSRMLLKILYNAQYPMAGPLVPAPDPSLLKRYGGPLTDEEYDKGAVTYSRSCNTIPTHNPVTQHFEALYDVEC